MNLSVIAVVRERLIQPRAAYELSSYGATFEYLRRTAADFTCSEYVPAKPFGRVYAGIRNEDVQRLTFGDASFDLVSSNSVFEHVVDDVAGFRECFRVLRPRGAFVFTVPLYETPTTVRLASLDAGGRLVWHGNPEYHDSRLGGPCSAPTFWRHSSNDICRRVASAGFSRVELVPVMIATTQREPQPVVCAFKS